MASLEFLQGGGSSPPPSGGKKKFKMNKKNIIIFGSLAIVAFLVINTLFKRGATSSEAGGTVVEANPNEGMPTNSVDVAGQLQNFQSRMQEELKSQFTNYANEQNVNNNTLVSDMTGIIGNLTSDYNTKLQEQTEKNNAFFSSNQEQVNLLAQSLNDLRAIPKVTTPTRSVTPKSVTPKSVTPKAATAAKKFVSTAFKTGTFGNEAEANKVAQEINKTYGGTGTRVVNEGGKYRVTSNFSQDEGKAGRVLDKLKERKLIGVGYVG